MTQVMYKKFNEGDLIAIFPYDICDRDGDVQSYQKIGQHGACRKGNSRRKMKKEFFALQTNAIRASSIK